MSENNFQNGSQNSENDVYDTFSEPGVTAGNAPYVTFVPYGYTLNTYREKQKIRKTALAAGCCFLAALGIMFFWSFIYLFVMSRLGFTTQKAREIISDPAVLQIVQVVISTLTFTLPFIVIYKSFGYRISELVPLKKPKGDNLAALFFLGISFCAFANIATSQASYFFESFGIDYNVDYGDNPKGFFGFILSVIATAIVPGLVEEFACRGIVLGSLRKYGDAFALITSSAIFGLMHGNFEQMPFAFTVGLVLGFLVLKTGSLWLSVAVHVFNNLVSVVFSYLPNSISQQEQNVIYSLFLAVCLVLGVLAVALLSGSEGLFKFRADRLESTNKQRFKWFFTSPIIIVFTVFCFLESLIYFGG